MRHLNKLDNESLSLEKGFTKESDDRESGRDNTFISLSINR